MRHPPCQTVMRCALAGLATMPSWTQETDPAAAPTWTGSVAASLYVLPEEDAFVLPTLIARRDRLHLEARYNYEDLDTASLFAGWVFQGGSSIEFEATPMLGAVVGATDGMAVACTVSVDWKRLALYSENE